MTDDEEDTLWAWTVDGRGNWRRPKDLRRITSRDDRVRALVESLFSDARMRHRK